LRKLARHAIQEQLESIAARLRVQPGRLYVMGQKTKWGNCSAKQNLSFNWRIVLAPAFVLRYLVTHEVAHLAVPDHSQRFWLTVQSICPEAERARGWLSANSSQLMVDLGEVLERGSVLAS
jgi:predicted metal-dependent hydrolase